MGKIKDLLPRSQAILANYVKYWELGIMDLNRDLDSPLDVETSGFGPLAGHFLHYAIQIGDTALAQDLCAKGANANQRDNTWTKKTPLQLAYEYGRSDIIRILLDYNQEASDIEIDETMNPCRDSLTFLWSIKEWSLGKNVDYTESTSLIEEAKRTKKKM